MRYLFPILLLAASILLCICAAPSVVTTLYPAASVSGAITLPGTMLPQLKRSIFWSCVFL